MINEKNATYLFVGNVANGIADEASYTGMAAGSIAVVRALDNLNEESAISGTTPVRIVQKNTDGTYKFSPIFNYSGIQYKESEDFSPNVQQVSYFGYDGTSNTTGFGSITSGDTYTLHVVLGYSRNTYNNAPEIKTVPYKTTSTSEADLAKGLQEGFIRQFTTLREPNPVIRAERVVDIASAAALTGSAVIYKLTKGSTTVSTYIKTADGTVGLTASTASVTAGNIIHAASSGARTFTFSANALGSSAGHHAIYIGETTYLVADAGDAAANGTAICAAINAGTQATASGTTTVTITYRPDFYALPPMVMYSADDSTWANLAVTSASGDTKPVAYKAAATTSAAATFELDVAWQGETGYLYEGTGTTTTAGIGIGTATAGYWGLKLSGLVQPFNPINDSMTNYLVNFDITTGDFGSLVEYKSQKPKYGTGTWQSVAYQEFYSQGLSRDTIRSIRPLTQYNLETDENVGYDIITLSVRASSIQSQTTGLTFNSDFRIIIATQATPTDLDGDALKTVFAVS